LKKGFLHQKEMGSHVVDTGQEHGNFYECLNQQGGTLNLTGEFSGTREDMPNRIRSIGKRSIKKRRSPHLPSTMKGGGGEENRCGLIAKWRGSL